MESLKAKIRDIPDFPKPGIVFKDITPLLADGPSFRRLTEALAARYADRKVDLVVGVEARGFIIGSAVAYVLGAGIVLIRKQGKLPYKTQKTIYQLEYGTDTLEIHEDAMKPGQRVLIMDDLLATGGTVSAAIDLVNKLGGKVVGIGFLVELTFLRGRERLRGQEVFSLVQF